MGKQKTGSILKAKRVANNLSVNDIKRILGKKYGIDVSMQTIYKWEDNTRSINTECLLALCDIYEIRDVRVLDGSVMPGKEAEVLTDEERYILRKFRTSQNAREKIRAFTSVPFSFRK